MRSDQVVLDGMGQDMIALHCMGFGVVMTGGQTCEVFVCAIRDVLQCFRVSVLLAQPEVDDVHHVQFLANAHQEVVGLDVPAQKRGVMGGRAGRMEVVSERGPDMKECTRQPRQHEGIGKIPQTKTPAATKTGPCKRISSVA